MSRQKTGVQLIREWDALDIAAKFFIARQLIERDMVGHLFFADENPDLLATHWAITPFAELPYGWQSHILSGLRTYGHTGIQRLTK
jgi:hypothetical protein